MSGVSGPADTTAASMAPFTERAVAFACAGDTLLGVLAVPRTPCDTAVVVVVGGPQYRAGSHRQFVRLARRLAAAGHAVLRFDVRGMGDSGGTPRTFEAVDADVAAALDAVQREVPAVRRIVLWGLCDGASAALLYCHGRDDARVAGLCLLNPWVRTEAGLARTQVKHYYLQRLREPAFWTKLLRGGIGPGALLELAGKLVTTLRPAAPATGGTARTAEAALPYTRRMALAWTRFEGRVLLILSGRDYTAKEFVEHARGDTVWQRALARPGVERHDVPTADHTFSDADARDRVERLTLDWLRASPSSPAGALP